MRRSRSAGEGGQAAISVARSDAADDASSDAIQPKLKLGAFVRNDVGENTHPREDDALQSKHPPHTPFLLHLPSSPLAHLDFKDDAIRHPTIEEGLHPSISECRLEPG